MDSFHRSDGLTFIGARPTAYGAVDRVFKFGRFTVTPRERLLQVDGKSVELGGRAFDLLVTLLETRGSVVAKDEILKQVWPSTIVSDVSLRVQISTLRQLLGSDGHAIKSVRGRGYILTEGASVNVATADGAAPGLSPVGLHPPGRRSKPAANRDNAASFRDPREVPVVAVIDDGQHTCEALQGLLLSNGYRAEVFASVQAFLDRSSRTYRLSRARRPDAAVGATMPVILMSGDADIPMSVKAIKNGSARVSDEARAR